VTRAVTALGDGERGQAVIHDYELVVAPAYLLQEFQRLMLEEATARRLDVTVEYEPEHARHVVRWKPTNAEPGVSIIRR